MVCYSPVYISCLLSQYISNAVDAEVETRSLLFAFAINSISAAIFGNLWDNETRRKFRRNYKIRVSVLEAKLRDNAPLPDNYNDKRDDIKHQCPSFLE